MRPQAEKMAEAHHERYQQTAEPHGRKKAGNLCGNGKPGERNDRAQTVWLDNENQRKRQIKRCKKKRRPQIRQEAETARVSLRNARRDAVEAFKKAQKEGMPEDESKDGETQVQKLLEKFSKTLDAALDRKEREIMTV